MAIHRSGWAYVRGLVIVASASSALAACHGRNPDVVDRLTGHAVGTRPAGESRTSALAVTAAAADPTAIVAALKARAGSPIGASVATGFASVAGGGLTPTFAASDLAAETKRADVTLPALATGAMHLVDTASAVAVDVALQGAVAVAGTVVNGFVVYPGGHSSGADVLQRSVVAGSEDFLAFGSKPSSQQITYALTRGAGAAGLRLVANTLEILDAGGVPRLRVAPPFIVGSDGTRTDATLAVTGCAVDTNPAGPWGRAVTPPGASTCTVKVSWPGSGVSYPAILDPRWGTVGFMGTSRYEHTLTLLSNGNVLAVGGRSSTSSTTALASAEVYNSATATWAATASLTSARRLHTATQLNTGSNSTTSGKVLVAGGISGSTTVSTFQLYSSSAGTWTTEANMNAGRHAHTATLLANGRVLAVGGLNGATTLQTAAVYDPASGSGTWTATTGSIPSALKNHTATLIQTSNTQVNNQVLLVGGNDGTQTIANVYLFDPTASTFSALTSLSAPRELHTAVTMPSSNGKILVAGGKNGSTVLSSALMYDPASGNGSWSSAGTMTSARMNHLMVALPQGILANGTVLVGGGSSTGSDTLSSSELFSGTATWAATSTMTGPLQLTQTVTLPNNKVLIAGGLSSSTVVKNVAYIYESSFGMACTADSQCAGSHCVNGVCCDNACNGGCGACNLPGHVGMCTAVTSGTVCRAANGACDVAEICSGFSTSCPGDGFVSSSTVCRPAADLCDQAESCPGNSASCPADAKLANGTACTDDGNPCTTDLCNGTSIACQHAAGNAGTQCRAAADVCDVAATCTGSSSTCPANSFKASSTVCRASAGQCDVAENCTGSSAACPTDAFQPSTTQCRAANGVCDLAETCTGSTAACPADAFKPSTTQCRAPAGVCDVAESCTGSGAACPSDAFASPSTVCRAASGQCDIPETCTGGSASCPADVLASNGTSCSDGNNCTGPDTCQSGTCTAGANTCASITVTEVINTFVRPTMSATLDADTTFIVPGDPITFTASVTNTGATTNLSGDIRITNAGSSTFTASGFKQTLEYQAVPSGAWTPFARVVYDNAGNVVPETTLQQITFWWVYPLPDGTNVTYPPNPPNQNQATGTTIAAGGNAHFGFGGPDLVLPADVVNIVFDPAQSAGIRAVISFDVPSAAPQSALFSLDQAYVGMTGDIDDVTVPLHVAFNFASDHVSQLQSSETGPLAPGASRIFTGTTSGPLVDPWPFFPGESEAGYAGRLSWAQLGYGSYVRVTGHAQPFDPLAADGNGPHIGVELPVIFAQEKSGPTTINAGLTRGYSVSFRNNGNSPVESITLTDSVDGAQVPVGGLSLPATLPPNSEYPASAGTASFQAQVPLDRPIGPMTDVATINWQDRKGNLYGPLTASYTTTVTPGHPEGYLSVAVATGITDTIGISKPMVVTALDAYENPAPGVVVHFVVTGDNPQTGNAVTGSDGKATFSYSGTQMGDDTVTVSATIATTEIVLAPIHVQWAQSVGTPCMGRATPLDVMLMIDVSGSMVLEPPHYDTSAGKLEAARAAAHRFLDNLTAPLDQVGVVAFRGGIDAFTQLSTNAAAVKQPLDDAINGGIICATNLCNPLQAGSNIDIALDTALNELESPRHRPEATKVLIYIGDGGIGADPTPQITRLHASGTRAVVIAIGAAIDGSISRAIASTPNDYFYSPSGAGVDFAFNNLNQDLCRNLAPFVSAGGDQGVYDVRIPASLTLQGEVHDDGAASDSRLTSTWTVVSGPGPVAFTDASSPTTDALFGLPGTYVLQLAASDGYLTVIDRATVTVDPDPSIVGANLAVALTAPGPLETGQNETLTATLTDSLGVPIRDYAVRVTVAGANPVTTTIVTDAFGVAVFVYQGGKTGTDVLHATALGSSFSLDSGFVTVDWVQPASGGAFLAQGWIGAPLDQAKVTERVPVTLSPGVTLSNGTLIYFPASTPTDVHVVATNLSGQPGATLATFDTTMLSNGSYILQLDGTNQAGNQKTSVVLLTVTGEYKPGRVTVELTDLTVPIAGLPITIGRRYDSLEKDKVGDFGNGWSLAIGHPRLEVNPNLGVSLTLPNGRRATFDMLLAPVTDEFNVNVFAGFYGPSYKGEPGVYGSLTQEGGCPIVKYNPANPANPLTCLLLGTLPYAPDSFTYTDPYGTAYRMAASGELKSIKDRQGNTLSFEPNGIVSSTGKSVSFVRDTQGRITKIDYPDFFGPDVDASQYTYDTSGDLTTVELAKVPGQYFRIVHHTYAQHRLLTSTDPNGNAVRTSTYDANGRLATDKDALNHVTSYAYDLVTRTNTTTAPDTGVVSQTFDAQGMLLSQTDQLGNTTTHEYDANLNETKRTNALGEITTAIYDGHGNQTSVTDPTGTTHMTYNEQNLPITFKDRLGHVTTIEYDDRQVPKRVADELGTTFTFVNSEQGLPLTVDDAAGKRAYLEYDLAGNVTARTDWLGRVTRATYDDAGNRRTQTSARGAVTTTSYQFDGKVNSTIDPFGYQRYFGHDSNGNVTIDLDPTIRQTNYTYNVLNQVTEAHYYLEDKIVTYTRDFRGNPLTMTDQSGRTTTYEYDLAGQLTKTTFPGGTFTTRTYDGLNRLASTTDERGNTTTYEYDAGCGCADRVTRVTDPLGHATVTVYDANGRKSAVTDANNHTTSFIYDVRDHVIETDYPDGTSSQEAYDPRGRRISMTDQMGQTTLYGYDDQGQLTSVTDPLSNVTHYAYDLDGNLTSATDANNHTTTYEYDVLKRKTKRTLPLGQYETFAYDVVGRQSAHTDLRGKTTTMTYDSRDRILTKVPDPSLGEPSHAYVYSPTGMRLSSVDGSGTTTYTYDLRDRMLTKAATAGTLTYTYDATGNVATIRSSNANGTSVDYAWDAANHLASVTDNRVGGTTTAAYTSTNRPLTLTQPNGIGLTYSYDALDRVTSMLWRHGTAPAFASWAYTHNERGQRLSSKDITGRAATYTYDPASRLATETINGDPRGVGFDGVLSYVLDGGGNRITRTSTVATLATQTFSYDGNDQLSTDAYDANGNTVASGGHVYAYDFEDRLISTDNGTVTIAYDCDGNRVAKTAGGINTRYVVDDSNPTRYAQVLEETVGGAVQARYTYGTRIVSQTRNVAATPATDYFGFDGHGNITFLTDSSGAVTDSYDYDAWGNVVGQNGSTPNTRLFAGEEFDSDLGFINLRARYFNPRSGRFITSDPMPGIATRPMGLNRYLYGSNDPVGRVDPAGLASLAEDTIFIRYVVGALLFTTATIVVGNTKATIPSVSYPAAKISCAFMGIATGLSSAIVDGYTWVPGLCAIRLPWTKDKPKVESVPGREAICGPQPPFYPPECDKVGDDAYDECYPVVQNVEYCLEQRQVVVDACLETEEEEKMKYAQRFLEWERCMGIRPPNR